jgi:hypothetical protein
MQINELPVIETGAFKVFVVDLKTQWLNQMEGSQCGGAQSRHTTRVGWNFRFQENHMHV